MPVMDAIETHAPASPKQQTPTHHSTSQPTLKEAVREARKRFGIKGLRPGQREILEAVWAAAPQGGRERILLRACILISNGNLRLRMEKPGSAGRMFSEALAELRALGLRKAQNSGDGFADGFPIDGLAALLKARTEKPALTKADWLKLTVPQT